MHDLCPGTTAKGYRLLALLSAAAGGTAAGGIGERLLNLEMRRGNEPCGQRPGTGHSFLSPRGVGVEVRCQNKCIEERLLDQAQARTPYTIRPFGGSFA